MLLASGAEWAHSRAAHRVNPMWPTSLTPRSRSARPVATPPPGEPLWTLGKAGRLITCELRDDGLYGCEAQLLRDGDFYAGRRFTDRAGAVTHATSVRARLEADGWTPL